MITAKEARALVETSTAQMADRLEAIEKVITEAATLGKREVWLSDALPYSDEYKVKDSRYYQSPMLTPVQELIAKELRANGFMFDITLRNVQVGGGLGSMDDEVTHKALPYLRVWW